MIPHWLQNSMSAIHQSWRGKQSRFKRTGMKHLMPRIEDLEPRMLLTVSAIDHSYTTTAGQALYVSSTNGVLAGASTTATPSTLMAIWTAAPPHGTLLLEGSGAFVYMPNPTYVGTDTFPVAVTDFNFDTVMRTVSISVNAPAPVLSPLSVSYGNDRQVTLSGTVSASSTMMLMVSFSGVVSGSTMVNSDGSFSFSGTATGVGTVSAQAQMFGLTSNITQLTLAPPAPVLQSFSALVESSPSSPAIVLSGNVTCGVGQASMLMVTFNGAVTTIAPPDTVGNFYNKLDLHGTTSGVVFCVVLDAWGNFSNMIQQSFTV